MPRSLQPSAFVPPGFHVENAVHDGALTIITVRHTSKASRCPSCAMIASASIAAISDAWPICRWQVDRFDSSSSHGVSDATLRPVVAQFSRSASATTFWRRGRAEPHGSIASSITSDLPSAADRPRASLAD